MQSYEFNPEEKRRIRRSLNIRVAVPIVIIALVLLLSFYSTHINLSLATNIYLWLTMIVSSICGFILFNLILRIDQSLKIILDMDQLIQKQSGAGQVVIRRDEIKQIVEIEMWGIRIKSNSKSIFIPIELPGYTQIRSSLMTWSTLTSSVNRTRYALYLILGSFPLILVLMMIKSTRPYSLVLAVVMFWLSLIMVTIETIKRLRSKK